MVINHARLRNVALHKENLNIAMNVGIIHVNSTKTLMNMTHLLRIDGKNQI